MSVLEQIIVELYRAFPLEPVPGKELGEICGSFEGDNPDKVRPFQMKRWDEVTVAMFASRFGVLCAFTSLGLRYYLPGLVLISLHDFGSVSTCVSSLLWMLEDASGLFADANEAIERSSEEQVSQISLDVVPELNKRRREFWMSLTEDQLRVVLVWLKWIQEMHGNRFLEGELEEAILAVEQRRW